MAYFFTLLLLALIILLIIGLFNPQRSLFWFKGERTKKKSLTIYSTAALISIFLLVITIPNVPEVKKEVVAEAGLPPLPADSTAKQPASATPTVSVQYQLPGSEYAFNVVLSDIKTKLIKDAFSIKEDEYVAPAKKDGYELSFACSMTNPYDKEMICPAPEDFYIASPDKKFFSDRKKWNTSCECNVDDVVFLTTEDGRKMSDIPNTLNCGNTHGFCLTYKPGETKHFIITFGYPVLISERNLLLWGFDRKEKSGRKMAYDKCWVINTDSKGFTGELLYK